MRYPQMSLELRHDSSRNLIHGVINGELNLAFLGLVPAKEALLESYILFTQPFFLLVPANHPLSNRKQVQLNELKDEPFVFFQRIRHYSI